MAWGQPIDGETPLDDRDGLLDRSITTRGELYVVEAENVRLAVVKYLAAKPSRRSAKFDFGWFLALHREMFGNVWSWAGSIRDKELNLGVPVACIAESLAGLVANLKTWEENWPDTLEQAVHLHHQAVRIHPFRNGNGRWSRMLANVWLKMHDSPFPEWPVEIGVETSSIRKEYLDCVQKADDGEFGPLYQLHKRHLPQL